MLKNKPKKQQPRITYKGKPSQPDLASPACPTHPCQHRQPSPASQPNQHSTANTPQPTPREWGPAAGGVALKIRRTPEGGAGRDGILAPFSRICIARQAPPLPPAPAQSAQKSTTFLTSQNERNKITKRVTVEGLRGPLRHTLMPFD